MSNEIDMQELHTKVRKLERKLNKTVAIICKNLRDADIPSDKQTPLPGGLATAHSIAVSFQDKLSRLNDKLLASLDPGSEEDDDHDGWEDVVEEDDGVLEDLDAANDTQDIDHEAPDDLVSKQDKLNIKDIKAAEEVTPLTETGETKPRDATSVFDSQTETDSVPCINSGEHTRKRDWKQAAIEKKMARQAKRQQLAMHLHLP